MFWLKKVVSFWLMPLPVCVGLLFVGVALLRSARRPALGRRLVLLAAVLLFLFSNRFVSLHLLGPLEARYPAIPEASARSAVPAQVEGCAYVVVLGSANSDVPGIPATSRLSTSGLGRLVEAIRILNLLPSARLIVSGPGRPGHPSHAAILALAAESLGVSPGRITLIEDARDTEDESRAVAGIVAGKRTALVTSAWHMPRAAALFGRAGVTFVPCPSDFGAGTSLSSAWQGAYFDSESLERSTLAVHEWIGLLWLRLRDAI